MKRLATLVVLLSIGIAPVLPANPVQMTAAVEVCSMDCCHETPGESATACQCASPCVLPAHTSAAIPAVTEVSPPVPKAGGSDELFDEFAAARYSRPPVPPPRA